MFDPDPNGRYRLDHRTYNHKWECLGCYRELTDALAYIKSMRTYRVTDRTNLANVQAVLASPGVITLTFPGGAIKRVRKPGAMPSPAMAGVTGKKLEKGFAINPAARRQSVPVITTANDDDPAFGQFLEMARRGAAFDAAVKTALEGR